MQDGDAELQQLLKGARSRQSLPCVTLLQTVGTVDPSLEGIWCKTETSRQKLNLSAAWSLKEKS